MTALTMNEVLRAIHKLPSLPAVVLELLASLDQEEINIDELSKKVACDQGLTARTLKVANSSFYGMPQRISSVSEAIAVLGFQNVRNLVTTTALISGLTSGKHAGFAILSFWRHSIATAACARAIAATRNVHKDYAYTAGLLHDIGRLVLATQFPDAYEVAMAHRAQSDCHAMEAEREVLGMDHAVVGEALAKHWQFPLVMQQAVANHHHPDGGDTMAQVVHLADAVAHALGLSQDEDDMVPPVSSAAWSALGLGDAELLGVFRSAEKEYASACLILAE